MTTIVFFLVLASVFVFSSAFVSPLRSGISSSFIASSFRLKDNLLQQLELAEKKLALQLQELEALKGRIRELEMYKQTGRLDAREGTLKDLCQISKDACDILTPMVRAFYQKCSDSFGTAKLKNDATFFTIADGIVQHLLVEYLLSGNKFAQIVGEEDETKVNIVSTPFTVDDLIVPPEFESLIETTRDKIQELANRIDSNAYRELTVFVDPIDGTREFATGKGKFCSMLMGYNDAAGKPVAGIIYRPLTEPATWAAGAKSEGCVMGFLDQAETPNPTGVLVTDGQVTPFLEKVIEELKFQKVPAYASGNRALMLVEGKAGAYIRDTGGFAKWDCSGPQAVLEAYGGIMSKLPKFLEDKTLTSYTYLKTKKNLDFVPDTVMMTLSNAKDKKVARLVRDVLATEVDLIKEYACVQGLLALTKENAERLDTFQSAMNKVKASDPPIYT